jgi:recombination protein RecR
LPSIGQKTAQRLAFHLLRSPREDAMRLSRAIAELRERVSFCRRCYTFAERELCRFCSDERRDSSVICVVEAPQDIVAIERTGEYRGRYHVLGGAISPIEGVGPEELRIKELLIRIEPEGVTEVIVATNPTIEGEATALFLARVLRPSGIRVTRPASGLPVGGDLEYADELTLGRALEGRRELKA